MKKSMFDPIEDEFPVRHRKKKIKTTIPRSKHPHEYKEIILVWGKTNRLIGIGEYCTICRKLKTVRFFGAKDLEDAKTKYPHLAIQEMPEEWNIFDKYI